MIVNQKNEGTGFLAPPGQFLTLVSWNCSRKIGIQLRLLGQPTQSFLDECLGRSLQNHGRKCIVYNIAL